MRKRLRWIFYVFAALFLLVLPYRGQLLGWLDSKVAPTEEDVGA